MFLTYVRVEIISHLPTCSAAKSPTRSRMQQPERRGGLRRGRSPPSHADLAGPAGSAQAWARRTIVGARAGWWAWRPVIVGWIADRRRWPTPRRRWRRSAAGDRQAGRISVALPAAAASDRASTESLQAKLQCSPAASSLAPGRSTNQPGATLSPTTSVDAGRSRACHPGIARRPRSPRHRPTAARSLHTTGDPAWCRDGLAVRTAITRPAA